MSERRRLVLLAVGAFFGWGCTSDPAPDSDPLIRAEDGVEVATPPAVPAPTDPRYEWAEDPRLPADGLWWRMFSLHGRYVGMARVPADVAWLWQGADRFWAYLVTADGEPVLQELTLSRKTVE